MLSILILAALVGLYEYVHQKNQSAHMNALHEVRRQCEKRAVKKAA